MKHTYNNWSTDIFEGFYESNLWNSDSLYWIEESDRQEGYLNDNEEYDIDDFEAFTKEVSENAVYFLFEALDEHDVIKDMKFKDLYSPKYYNYETDSLIIDVDVDMRKLKKYCFTTKKEAFNQYLKDNFTSCDGFISYISNNIKDWSFSVQPISLSIIYPPGPSVLLYMANFPSFLWLSNIPLYVHYLTSLSMFPFSLEGKLWPT